ncbi:SDR family oxidoreductase [Marinimicrobium sp. ABcell2]|uniref:SDR family oxidoreductase n=1 Tax=Marinimicrobium sp. ABcell2 TaxID=3069751 RepID=UPI0027AF9082|nr:SDR family oxidoreductase [Marinimicrobium sp. ABcell2]MDQ2076688.1 SDR family oxidoreductase [Marinimicrobium sp. ABcell2]
MNSEKLLIVGCGDIGRRLADQLKAAPYQVTGVRRQPPGDDPELRYLAADTGDRAALEAVVQEGFDVVVVTLTPAERSDEGYRRAYVQGCTNLVEALHRQGRPPRLLVYVSSTSVYGQQSGEWVDENSATEPTRVSARRLLEAEQVIINSGFEHCIVRLSGIYGPGRDRLIEQVRQGRASLSSRYTNRIHADDAAGVIAHLIERHRKGEPIDKLYLANDNEPAPMAEVVNWLAMHLHIHNARFAAEQNPSGHKRCDNRRLRATGYVFRYPTYKAGYSALLGIQDPEQTLPVEK